MKLAFIRLFSNISLKDKYLSLLTITVLLLYSLNGSAQYDSTRLRQTQNGYGFDWKNTKSISSQIIPKDTFHLSVSDSGAIAYKGLKLWVYNGYSWLQSSSSSIGGGGVLNAYDSVTFNIDSSYYKFYSSGSVVDTINTLVKNLYGLGRIHLIDSTNGNGYINWDSTGFTSIDTTSISNRINNSYFSLQSSIDSNSFIIQKPNGLQDTVVVESVSANSFSLPYKSFIAKIEMDGTRQPIITIYTNNTGKTVTSITSPSDKVIKIVFSANMATGIFNWTIPAYPGNSNWLGAINFDSMNDLRFEGSVSNNFVCFLDIKFF